MPNLNGIQKYYSPLFHFSQLDLVPYSILLLPSLTWHIDTRPMPTRGGSLFRKTFSGLVCAQQKRLFWPGGFTRVKGQSEAPRGLLPSHATQSLLYPWFMQQVSRYQALCWIEWNRIWSGTETLPTRRFQPRLQSREDILRWSGYEVQWGLT